MEKTVAIYTLGCKVNQNESQGIINSMRERGWLLVPFSGNASVYIVNTCTVTQVADQKSRKAIRNAKRRNPASLLVVTGCYANSGQQELTAIHEIDLILGNELKETLPDRVEEVLFRSTMETLASASTFNEISKGTSTEASGETSTKASEVISKETSEGTTTEASMELARLPGDMIDAVPVKGIDRVRASIKLQDGCQQFCSYCIIPYVRNRLYSLPMEDAIVQMSQIADEGFREVVLLGIHLGAYGTERDQSDGLSTIFQGLLEAFPQIRFRLSSLEPMEATEKLIQVLRDYPNACEHLHLPLQSGSDSILKRMNRPYRSADYREKLHYIRHMLPDIAISTDIVVGFPGETEEDHAQSLAFTKEMEFSQSHIFMYSKRTGTAAASMDGQVPKSIKEERSKAFLALSRDAAQRYGASWIGRSQMVLLEEELASGVWIGHSSHYLEVTYMPAEDRFSSQGFPSSGDSLKGSLLPLIIEGKSRFKAEAWHGVCAATEGK